MTEPSPKQQHIISAGSLRQLASGPSADAGLSPQPHYAPADPSQMQVSAFSCIQSGAESFLDARFCPQLQLGQIPS